MLRDVGGPQARVPRGDVFRPPDRLTYALATLEDDYLETLIQLLHQKHPTGCVTVSLFDGLVFSTPQTDRGTLPDTLDEDFEECGIHVVVTVFWPIGGGDDNDMRSMVRALSGLSVLKCRWAARGLSP